ncbi:BamA/TamA family outer membrane protein [Filimonas lacunae]|nr:BamA/TamA family outer membrane protein [Filimonas lacunae]BAV07438.1 outer membrane protein [Filimonas lacunae]
MPQNKGIKDTARQTDLIDIAKELFHIRQNKPRSQEEKKIYFSALPFGGTLPGGSGRALITSTTAGIYLGARRTTYMSTATFAPYWNFKGRFGLPLRTSVWLPDNTWNIQGDTRFMVYPQYTWGLGNHNNDENNRVLINYKYIRFYQSALKRIRPYLFAGLGYHLDYRFNIQSDDPEVDVKQFTQYAYGLGSKSLSSGVSLNLLYDTRNNAINPLPGAYMNLVYRINPTFLGSDHSWQSVYLDVRKYMPLNKARVNQQNMLAFWSYFWTALNNTAPYLDLPSTGWDPYNRSARGIDQNRYRGKSLLYLESEYRRDITNNGLLGFVVFANANTVSGAGKFFASWHPAAGAGLRIKFNKGSNTNIGIDYGFSKGYSSIMLNLGEAF